MRFFKTTFSSNNKKILISLIGSLMRVIFLRESKILFYQYLKFEILPRLFYPASSALRSKKMAIWNQIKYNKLNRSTKSIGTFFSNTLIVCITYKCNLSCRYCYVKGIGKSLSGDMASDDFLRLITWARDKGWNRIRLLGGEPTSHPGFTEMLGMCRDKKMLISLSTNNTFSSQIADKFDRSLIKWVSINYVSSSLNDKQRALFKDNLKHLCELKIPLEFSYIIGCEDDDSSEFFEDARIHKPFSARVSVAIPGLLRQTSISELTNNFKLISQRLFKFQEECLKINVPFYIYRPLMPCMFSTQEWRRLTKDFPFICYTRCPLGARGDYSATLTVNPDLSIFPCIAVFLKGPNIFTFKSKKEISDFYKQNIKRMLTQPLMKSCLTCDKRDNFLDDLDKGEKSDLKSCFKQSLCQGGCLSFRDNAQFLCCSE